MKKIFINYGGIILFYFVIIIGGLFISFNNTNINTSSNNMVFINN